MTDIDLENLRPLMSDSALLKKEDMHVNEREILVTATNRENRKIN